MSRIRVCIATWELKPFTGGGIGTLVHNLITECRGLDQFDISILWYGDKKLTAKTFGQYFPTCGFFRVQDWSNQIADVAGQIPAEAYLTARHYQSHELMRALKAIETSIGVFDVIEFPDFAGAAFSTIQEKLLGRGFSNSTIAVRLHSTEGILRNYDHRPPGLANAHVADMERKALLDADLIISHLEPVSNSVAQHFNLPQSWHSKTCTEVPPVTVDSIAEQRVVQFKPDTPLVFTSKIQWFKRPHVFINAAVSFMRSHPDYTGEAHLLAHVIDGELQRHCEDLIPYDLKDRIKFYSTASGQLRDHLIKHAIAIFPSAYESFCLAAYEASQLGAVVVLNEQNPAFVHGTPWQNKVNCRKFDGTTLGLVRELTAMWNDRDLANACLTIPSFSGRCWSERPQVSPPTQTPVVKKVRQSLSLVIAAIDGAGDPIETLNSALAVEDLNLEVVISCDYPPSAPHVASVLDRLRGSKNGADLIKILQMDCRGGLAALCNQGARIAQHELLGFVAAGTAISAEFLHDAVGALTNHSEFDFVLPQRAFMDISAPNGFAADRVRIGEALNCGISENFFGDIEMVCRREAALSIGFDEDLDRYVDWDFHMRACAAGHRYIVSNYIEANAETILSDQNYRAHLDSLLIKHSAELDGGRVSLASAFDARGEGASANINSNNDTMLFAKRPVAYYLHETRNWKEIAWRHPTKPLRWLIVRELQKRRERARREQRR